jgi:hypothetical protein
MTTAPLGEALLAAVSLWIVHFKLTRGLDEQLAEVRRRGASEWAARFIGWSYCLVLWTLTATLGWMVAAALVRMVMGHTA